MKHFALLFLLSFAAILSLSAENHRVYSVAFDVRLADLYKAAATQDDRAIPGDKLLVIDAEVGSVNVREDTEEAFSVEVELVGGSWEGDEKIILHRAYVLFKGDQYRELFAKRAIGRVSNGEHIIVLGHYTGLIPDYDKKTKVALIEGVELRRIR